MLHWNWFTGATAALLACVLAGCGGERRDAAGDAAARSAADVAARSAAHAVTRSDEDSGARSAAGAAADRAADAAADSPADTAAIVAIGDSAAVALAGALMARVQQALREGGPAHAIDFCSGRALPITAAVQDSLPGGLTLKRTSTRIRNPLNSPDSLERAALAYFESELAAGRRLPPYHVQRADGEWRYYKPIVVAEFCTQCHGPRDRLDPAVRKVLAERYPNDQATGYSPGDFRGLIRVSVPGRTR